MALYVPTSGKWTCRVDVRGWAALDLLPVGPRPCGYGLVLSAYLVQGFHAAYVKYSLLETAEITHEATTLIVEAHC